MEQALNLKGIIQGNLSYLEHGYQRLKRMRKLDLLVCLGLGCLMIAAAVDALLSIVLLAGTSGRVAIFSLIWIALTFIPLVLTIPPLLKLHENLHAWVAIGLGIPQEAIKILPASVRLPMPNALHKRLLIRLAPILIFLLGSAMLSMLPIMLIYHLWGSIAGRLALSTCLVIILSNLMTGIHDLANGLREIVWAKIGGQPHELPPHG